MADTKTKCPKQQTVSNEIGRNQANDNQCNTQITNVTQSIFTGIDTGKTIKNEG